MHDRLEKKSTPVTLILLWRKEQERLTVKDMHCLIDGSSLTHHNPWRSSSLGSGGQDINGFESHLLESGLIGSSNCAIVLGEGGEIVSVNVTVQPGRHS